MIPKYQNPHLLAHDLVPIDRAEIYDTTPSRSTEDDDGQLLALLDKYLKSRLAFDELPLEPERIFWKDAQETEQGASSCVSFHLLSSVESPRNICIKQKFPKALSPLEFSYEDNEHEAVMRRLKAQSAAIDFNSLKNEQVRENFVTGKDRVLCAAFDTSLKPPTIMIAKMCDKSLTSKLAGPATGPIASSQTESLCCPIISVTTANASDTGRYPSRQRRRRKSKANVIRLPARFFRQESDWGGKSLGYAWGYAGGRPLKCDSGYIRDCMKRGIYYMEDLERTSTQERKQQRKPRKIFDS